MPIFNPVKRGRASGNVVGQIKEAILSGAYKTGEKLPSERELTEQFQVSRVVVREAVRELELAGFVTIRQGPTGGAYVTELGFGRLEESYFDLFMAGKLSLGELVEVRLYLEPEVTRLAALNVTRKTARLLKETLEAEAVPALSHEDWVKRNMDIDYVLAEMCGNRLYRAMLEPLLGLTQKIVLVVKPERTVIHDHQEHVAIVSAVTAGKPDEARQAMTEHLSNVSQGLTDLEKEFRRKTGISV